MTVMLDRPPPSRPWWHIRPAERRPLAWIVGVGGPVGFLAGALLGIFLQVPGPPGPTPAAPLAGRGTPVTTSVAPPEPRSAPAPARLSATGSDAATRRAAKQDGTRPAAPVTTRRAAPTVSTTVTTTITPTAAPTSSSPPSSREGPAPEGGDSLGADPS